MRTLSELDVLIVDCQATGATPALGSILELGWGVVRAAASGVANLQAHWIVLPEGTSVPPVVRRLTGFDDRITASALEPHEAWARLRASMTPGEAMPAAIHFAQFELRFLREWAGRFEPGGVLPMDAVCVHAVARRLYPHLPRRSLRALAGFLGHGLDLTRHSLGHVEATAFVWRKLVVELAGLGVGTWSELREWLAAPTSLPPRSSKRQYPFDAARRRALTEGPGVYHFLRANGDVLYVGKAASVKKRVASHFVGRVRNEHALEMLSQVSDVVVTPTATALEAAILENETIKSLRPPYNVQLIDSVPWTWFADHTFDGAVTVADERHPFGPVPSELSLRPLGALLALLSGSAPSPLVRARAVAAPESFAPDEVIFAEGFARFSEARLAGVARAPDARLALLRAARTSLWASKQTTPQEEPESELAEDASTPRTWDAERVMRHLERAMVRAYQLLRRARWLRLLHESIVVYREPGNERFRLLVVRQGNFSDARDAETPTAQELELRSAALRFLGSGFERAKYDRLRVLTSELKRVYRDGGNVRVYVARRCLRDSHLGAIFRSI